MRTLFYKNCAIEIFISGTTTDTETKILGYYAIVELPEEKGSIDSCLTSTEEAALYEGIRLAEQWRLQP